MKNRIDSSRLRGGMQVYGPDGEPLGVLERFDDDAITVKERRYGYATIDRIEGDRIYLAAPAGGAGGAAGTARDEVVAAEGEVRVPVREERLEVEKRPVELGAVEVRKTVETEQQTVPVELEREEVHVERRDVADRPATEADLSGAFQEGTVRVPVRGEEAVARKEAVVTGEVAVSYTHLTLPTICSV